MRVQQHPLPANSAGCESSLVSLHFGEATNGKKTYIQASLHADEIPGMLVAHHLRSQLTALEQAGKIPGEVVLVQIANPIGLAQLMHGQPFGRFDLGNGVNFNRAYRNLTPELTLRLADQLGADSAINVQLVRQHARQILSEWQPKTATATMKKILQTLAIDADIVLDLHCDNEAVMHLYAATPSRDTVQPLARFLGAEAVLLSQASGGDPFDETCSRLWWELAAHFGDACPLPQACLAVTVELRGQTEVTHALAQQDAHALVQFLAYSGHIDLPAAELELPPAKCEPTPLEGVEPLCAPHGGIVVFHKLPGEMVQVGDIIADLIDPLCAESTPIIAGVAGKMFARVAMRYVQRGGDVAKIAGKTAFRSGDLLSD